MQLAWMSCSIICFSSLSRLQRVTSLLTRSGTGYGPKKNTTGPSYRTRMRPISPTKMWAACSNCLFEHTFLWVKRPLFSFSGFQISGKFEVSPSTNHKPGETIVKFATEKNAAMIVMGTRGLGSIRRTIMGSVSDFVVHHAHCPVIVCRQKEKH